MSTAAPEPQAAVAAALPVATASAVVVRQVSKAFAGVQALADVSLELRAGEIHALCGENGAGKSTLIKVLAGVHAPDAGMVSAWGAPLAPGSIHAAEAAGIAVIFQESVAFADLDVIDNLFVGREVHRRGGVLLDRSRMEAEACRWLAALGVDVSLHRPLAELTLAQRQLVAMARALSRQCRLLILDEPTAALSARETEVLFAILRRLRDQGVAVLYVSHRLEEVSALADRITVLRDGRWVATRPARELDRGELVRLMVGREVQGLTARLPRGTPLGEPRLQVTGLSRAGAFEDVSLTLAAGEIVGLAGLVGAGRSEVARCIMGVDRPDRGEVRVEGHRLPPGDVRATIRRGLAMVAEDRQQEGLVLPLSVRENLVMVACRALGRGWRDRARERHLAEELVAALGVRTPGIETPAEALSGGNQQKLVLGKWLAVTPRVLVLDEPTRGVDVGAKAEIHRLIRRLAEEGMATLLISSELPELLALSDRVLVLREGRLAGELTAGEATQEAVLHLALPAGQALSASSCPTGSARGPAEAVPIRSGSLPRSGTLRVECEGAPTVRAQSTRQAEVAISGEHGALGGLLARRDIAVGLLLAAIIGIVSVANPAFLAPGNLRDLLVNTAPVLIVAAGMMLVMVAGEIDISVGSLLGLLGALLGYLASPAHAGWPVWLAVATVLLAGAAAGLLNGALVALAGVPSIIVTLGMLTVLRAATEWIMAGQWITDLPPGLRVLGTGACVGVPVCVLVATGVTAAVALLARHTAFGRRVYAVGSNPHAAALYGISATRVRLAVFALTGLLTGLAAVVSVPQLSVVESGIGRGFELLVVTCVVVGGVSVRGGVGTMTGVLAGTFLLTILRTVLVFLPLGQTATYWERAIQGLLILAAVLVDHVAGKRRAGAGP